MRPEFSLSFMPGPTSISKEAYADIVAATQNHILEISHRGPEFTALSKSVHDGLRTFLNIPENHHIIFTSTASENWDMMATNLVHKRVHCLVNGNFSDQRKNFASWGKEVSAEEYPWGAHVDVDTLEIPSDAELVAIAYNETSTGVTYTAEETSMLRQKCGDALLAVDMTSNAGLQAVNVADVDVLYFSVQKGFGLPSGLGVCILSPRAYAQAEKVTAQGQAQSATNLLKLIHKMNDGTYQTVSTPNILNIYLLSNALARLNASTTVEKEEAFLRARAERIYAEVEARTKLRAQAHDAAHRSFACLNFLGSKEEVARIMAAAEAEGIALGAGYGHLKNDGIRIANYAALSDADFDKLLDVISQ